MSTNVAVLHQVEPMSLDRVHAMSQAAKAAAAEAAGQALEAAFALAHQCAALAEVDTLPPGQRDAFRRMSEELNSRATTIHSLRSRA